MIIPALFLLAAVFSQHGGEITNELLTLRLDDSSKKIKLYHSVSRNLLGTGELLFRGESGRWQSPSEVDLDAMKIVFEEGQEASFRLEENSVVLFTPGKAGVLKLGFHAESGPDAFPGRLKDQMSNDRRVLVTTLGQVHVPGASALFDPEYDLAIKGEAAGGVEWHCPQKWCMTAEGKGGEDEIQVTVIPDYYRKHLGVTYYQPMRKRSYWKTAPVVAMTWYGICGMKRPQDLELLKPEIDWVAENLLPYAGSLVFQLDDNYDYLDDEAMRALSDYIRSKGLVPGIWFTPFSVWPESTYQSHPDWFLHDGDGKRLYSFAGVNWKWNDGGQRAGVIDVAKPEAVEALYLPFWRKVSERWNFDFFKIDGQPTAVNAYRKSAGLESYRKGLELARSVVGADKFINGCWGMPIEGAGILDGSRTGMDTGYFGHAVNVVISQNYLNSVVWWCDPDAAAVLHDKPVEVVRLNAQARALTGQQFLTDDFWTRMPQENLTVWQRSFPMLDVRPANLYPIGDRWKEYDLFDLRIARKGRTYDVIGLFNYDNRPVLKKLDLKRLRLGAEEVHLFEYWSSEYLGRFGRDSEITVEMKALEGKLYSVVPTDAREPVLLSSTRHISQGGLDVRTMIKATVNGHRLVKGTSSNLVAGNPYELVFYCEQYRTEQSGPGLVRVRLVPETSGSLDWAVKFIPVRGPAVDLSRTRCVLQVDESATIEIMSHGDEAVSWRAVPSDPRIRLSSLEGQLDAGGDRTELTLSTDGSGLKRGSIWEGNVDVFAGGSKNASLFVRLHMPPPENLALKAVAEASSKWDDSDEYAAGRINDGRVETRWNSAQGDENHCWVQLAWPAPVTFDRIVIDECMDFGNRIQAWRLESGGSTVASGKKAGESCAVDLSESITTDTLKLIVESASVTPTIRELGVYSRSDD